MQLSVQLDSRIWHQKLESCGFMPVTVRSLIGKSLPSRAGSLTDGLESDKNSGRDFGMTTDMLKFLTKKLKSQSLSEGSGNYYPEDADDEERDSGTESDDNFDDDNPYGSNTSLNCLSMNNNNNNSNSRPDHNTVGVATGTKTHEISEHNFDTVSCTSDYERQSLDFDRHSSEDELGTINKENVAEKRKWSQVNCSGCCDSAGSSDEEVREYLLDPQPVLLSASPPKGVQRVKVYTRHASHVQRTPRQVLRVVPTVTSSVSPRKRHRQNNTSENVYDSDSGPLTQRPCLDFEKMQQVQAYV